MSKCAAIQMASSPNISFNLLEAEKLIAEAVKVGAKLVALPENFALMGDHETDKPKANKWDAMIRFIYLMLMCLAPMMFTVNQTL